KPETEHCMPDAPTQPKVICVGHAALDSIYRVGAMPDKAGKFRALEHVESGGGMAANAAAAIARAGGAVALWSRVGDDDAGLKIRRGLTAAGVDISHVARISDARSSTSAVIVDQSGDRMIVGARDINMPSETTSLPLEDIATAAVVLADLRWMEATRVAFARAREHGVPTVLDADLGGREALPELLELTDYAIFSEPALADFLPDETLKARLDRVMLFGPKHAGVTQGQHGYTWRDTFGGGAQPAFDVSVVDTTGAGDAFHGAFALEIAHGPAVTDCARFAAATAALSCTRLGGRAGLPSRSETERLIATR
ncbi:MAG: PfkB family carbohydrate kinase, partial [Pseudomonadota bacterium]